MILLYFLLLCGAIVNAASSLNFTVDSWSGIVTGVPVQLTWKGNTGLVNITLNNGTLTKPNVVNPIGDQHSFEFLLLDTRSFLQCRARNFSLDSRIRQGWTYMGMSLLFLQTAPTTTSALPSATAKPKSTSSKTSGTASSTKPPSSTSSPAGSDGDKGGLSTGAKVGIGVGCGVVALVAGALFIGFAVRRTRASRKKRSAEINRGGVEGTDGASDARPAEKSGLLGFGDKKGGEKGDTGVDQIHEMQANNGPGVQELDGVVRHELQ